MSRSQGGARSNAQGGAPGRWALLIGINEYRHAVEHGFAPLEGCLADVADMRALLINTYGFVPAHVAVLTNEKATRRGILDAIRRHLVRRVRAGDLAVLYFSGHGSVCFDPHRISNRDQTLVPYDGRDPDARIDDISGSDLNDALRALRTRNGIVILDSCHSGGMRTRTIGRVRAIPPVSRALTNRPDEPLGRLPSAGHVLLAASAPNEESFEMQLGGRARGLFTYALTSELRRAQDGRTYREVMDRIRAFVSAYCPTQHPGVEGTGADTFLFGTRSAPSPFYVAASPGAAGEVHLDGGTELGFTSGSLFSVFAPGTRRFDGTAPAAIVSLAEVRSLASIGVIVRGGPVAAGSRAIETSHRHGHARVRVSVVAARASVGDGIRARLTAVESVALVDGADAERDLAIVAGKEGIDVGRPDELLPVARIPYGPSAVDAAMTRIAKWTRWLRLLWLSNPSNNLAVDFTVSVKANSMHETEPTVECSVQNNSDRDLYLALLNLSDDGSIRLAYPIGEASLLYAGCRFHRRFALEPVARGQPCRHDIVKLLATTALRDFSVFQADAIRGRGASADPFDQLLLSIAVGTMRCGNEPVPCDWVAIERGFSYGAFKDARA